MEEHRVVVIGAGPSGVAAALSLRDRRLRPVLLDRADHVGSSWKARYDRLKLNTGRRTSHMPDRPYPKGTGVFPTRDQVVEHLDRHAHEDGIDLRLNTTVNRIDTHPDGWLLDTSSGDLVARQVVVATGYEHTPRMPEWPGMHDFSGEIGHSSRYRNPRPYTGKRVLVVGAGSSAMEIVHDVATGGAASAWLAVRTAPHIMIRALPGGFPSDYLASPLYDAPTWLADSVSRVGQRFDVGDLTEYGLPTPSEGVFARGKRLGRAPVIVDREVVHAIRARVFEVVPTIDRFDGDTVVLVDGRRLQPDAVICATGYTRGLDAMVGHLGVLDGRGLPRAGGVTPAAPGLRFVGFLSRPGLISYVAKQSQHVAGRIADELDHARTLTP
ncbi:flavin-containing monooxygenase [Mycolicibacterium litorale]|uniref:Monooxygenase n=1 Tax=Mycolicibacterium litorale TaxID=758802 RepID=A0AAD1IIX4_9MYCO|nr:NAD(P)/FAD-dependent oxidoreductase [Mycolicibacterium litorale]MCV7418795.1 NAD(P)/FAD-dependent oxidoreductase [Mycolicibacterium litorale]TDY00423.1 cation diffusion facilitator CzcD-associated flavoprotein CzcO [Mycolicibacterium litorale]BBY15741.1 monooxygenase [Mycolicibacterium litorale]